VLHAALHLRMPLTAHGAWRARHSRPWRTRGRSNTSTMRAHVLLLIRAVRTKVCVMLAARVASAALTAMAYAS